MTGPWEREEIEVPQFKYRSEHKTETVGISLLLTFALKLQRNLRDTTCAGIIKVG